jgi:hypothetical protein
VGNQGHGALWISLDGARSSPFLAEFIDAPAISSKSALGIILAKGKGKILFVRSSGRTHRSFTSPRHADPQSTCLHEKKPSSILSSNVYILL